MSEMPDRIWLAGPRILINLGEMFVGLVISVRPQEDCKTYIREGIADRLSDALEALLVQVDGIHVKHPQQSHDREEARAAIKAYRGN